MEIALKAYAKINYCIDILGLKDGYHIIDTVMSSIDLYDIVKVKKRNDNKINIFCHGVKAEDNTAYKAALLLLEKFNLSGADIEITKRIPFCSGLGGSSADAAAVIYAYMNFYGLSPEDVYDICVECGSDTPYMLKGGFARAEGRGEVVSYFNCEKKYNIVIAKPEGGVSAKDSYNMYDKLNILEKNSDSNAQKVINTLIAADFSLLSKYCINALQPASTAILPAIAQTIRYLNEYGASAAFMSGSGSCCAGIFESGKAAASCAENMCRKGFYAISLTSQKKGLKII